MFVINTSNYSEYITNATIKSNNIAIPITNGSGELTFIPSKFAENPLYVCVFKFSKINTNIDSEYYINNEDVVSYFYMENYNMYNTLLLSGQNNKTVIKFANLGNQPAGLFSSDCNNHILIETIYVFDTIGDILGVTLISDDSVNPYFFNVVFPSKSRNNKGATFWITPSISNYKVKAEATLISEDSKLRRNIIINKPPIGLNTMSINSNFKIR